eukprot:96205-Pelagomonas_calceolata.AAC.1
MSLANALLGKESARNGRHEWTRLTDKGLALNLCSIPSALNPKLIDDHMAGTFTQGWQLLSACVLMDYLSKPCTCSWQRHSASNTAPTTTPTATT